MWTLFSVFLAPIAWASSALASCTRPNAYCTSAAPALLPWLSTLTIFMSLLLPPRGICSPHGIPLHVSWFLPHPAGLAPLHVSYSHLQRVNTCPAQQLISWAYCSSHSNLRLDHTGLPIVLVLIPISHGRDARVTWCHKRWPGARNHANRGEDVVRTGHIWKTMSPKPCSQFLPLCIPSMYHHGMWK